MVVSGFGGDTFVLNKFNYSLVTSESSFLHLLTPVSKLVCPFSFLSTTTVTTNTLVSF